MKFDDPYSQYEYHDKVKLTTYISVEDAAALRTVRLKRGTVQTTINMLLHSLIKGLKENGITEYTQSRQFEEHVEGCAAALLAFSRNRETDGGDDRRGTKRVRRKAPRKSRKPSNDAGKRKGRDSDEAQPQGTVSNPSSTRQVRMICPDCVGTGILATDAYDEQPCPACGGRGKITT